MSRSIRPYRNRFGTIDNFEEFTNIIDSFFNDVPSNRRTLDMASFKVDIMEGEKGYTVEAELPGFNKEDIDITIDEGKLTISAARDEEIDSSDEEKNYVHRERRVSRMERTMYFSDIDEDNVKATLDKGLLKLEIPKQEELETKKSISIE